jgi:hypothetical protein
MEVFPSDPFTSTGIDNERIINHDEAPILIYKFLTRIYKSKKSHNSMG